MDLLNNDMSEFEKEIDLINESVGDFGIKPKQIYKKNGLKTHVKIDRVDNNVVYYVMGGFDGRDLTTPTSRLIKSKMLISSFLKNYKRVK